MSILRPQNEPVKWLDFIYLRDALDAAGCPICTLAERAAYRYLDNLFYENVTDPGIRLRLYDSLGFCNRHAWLATRIPHTSMGIAIIYEDLLRRVIDRIDLRMDRTDGQSSPSWRHARGRSQNPSTILAVKADCPACQTVVFDERLFVGELLRWFADAELSPAFERSFGLCLPHLELARREFPDHPLLPALLQAQRQKFTAVRAEIQEFNRNRDSDRATDPQDGKQPAWRGAIELFVGKREVVHRDRPQRKNGAEQHGQNVATALCRRGECASTGRGGSSSANRDGIDEMHTFESIRVVLDADHCAICAAIARENETQMTKLFHEGETAPAIRRVLGRAGGLCNAHGWLAARTTSALGGISIVYEELLETLIERTAAFAEPSNVRGKRRRSDPPSLHPVAANCPVCDEDALIEDLCLSNLLGSFDDPDFISKYGDSFGICLPHLQMALDERADHANLAFLLHAEREKLGVLGAELQEFIRKHDYRYADEPKGREQTSWTRIVEKFVGRREVIDG